MQRILLLDDDQNVLNALQRQLADTYEVETFVSPQAALRRARETDFALVVSDYRMPEMDGISFLEKFGQMQPDAVRLILSGQADMETLFKAITVTHIYRFLPKPWNDDDLKAGIRQGLDYREAILENRRFAEAYRQRFGAPPQARARTLYRVLLVSTDEHATNTIWRELTQHTDQRLYGAARQEITHHPHQAIHGPEFVVERFSSPLEALDYLNSNHCDLVIADLAMPEMDGVTFFGKLRDSGADSACMLAGDNPDMSALTEAINQVHIDSLLNPTWSGYEIKSEVLRALRYRDLRLENRTLADKLRAQSDGEGKHG